MAGWIFIHLGHRAALTQPHCEYNHKLGAPVRSTLLDYFADGVASLQRLEGILIYLAR